jgi:YbbR domain-containing protein
VSSVDKWLRNKNVVRVFSVLLGILLWVVVQNDMQGSVDLTKASSSKERTISNVSIRFVGLDENAYSLINSSNQHVTVKLSGKQSAVNKFNLADGNSRIVADLTNVKVGKRKVFLEARGYPDDIDVDIQPNYITIQIERLVEKEMPLSLTVTGQPAEGFVVGDSKADPNYVVISGLQSRINKVVRVVATVDVTDSNQTVSNDYVLSAVDNTGAAVKVDIKPTKVKIETDIVTTPTESTTPPATESSNNQ